MADQLKLRGGSEDASKNFTGAAREVTVDTTEWTLRVHDGVTAGGHKLLKSGNCLVVEEADKCDPNKPTCKVTVNGDLEVGKDVHIGGDLTIDGTIDIGDVVLDLETDDVTLRNPGDYTAHCNVKDGRGLKTQEDANKWFYEGIDVLDEELCKAQQEIIVLEKQYQDLEKRVDVNEVDIEALKKEIENLKQEIVDIEEAIKLLEIEIENNQNSIEQNQIDIAKLQVQMEFVLKGLEILNDKLDNLKLNDLVDVQAYAADGDVLTFDADKGLWVAKEPVQIDSGLNVLGFINVADPVSGFPQPGDTWIEHDPNVTRGQRSDDDWVIAHSSWVGIAGEKIYEGEYVVFSTDGEWHRGGGIHDVSQVNADWDEPDPGKASYILNKPDIDKMIDDALKDPDNVGNGKINVNAGNGLSVSGSNATANQKVDTTRTLSVKTAGGITIDGSGNVIIDPNFNLDGNVTKPNDGKLTIKDSDGATVGEFTADQAGNTDVTLPKGFSGDYGDLDNIPTEFPPSTHTHSYNDLTDKPDINDGKLTIKDSDGKSLGDFTANQPGDTEITLPAIPDVPITVGPDEPTGVDNGHIWVDTSECPPQMFIWAECCPAWVEPGTKNCPLPWENHDGGIWHVKNVTEAIKTSYLFKMWDVSVADDGEITYSNQRTSQDINPGEEVLFLTPKDQEMIFRDNTSQNWDFGPLTDTRKVTGMHGLLYNCKEFNGDISYINTSNVEDFRYMFYHCNVFKQPVDNIDTSKATTLEGMFSFCLEFDSSVSHFNTSNVESFEALFDRCYLFSHPVDNFDTSSATTMLGMFEYAEKFNHPVAHFDVRKVTTFRLMFAHAKAFNQPINNWELDSCTDTAFMFDYANSFNQPLDNWNMSGVTTTQGMFKFAYKFDQNINAWDVSSVKNFGSMFYNAWEFNSPLDRWDTSSAEKMDYMFSSASAFSQDLSTFDTSSVTNLRSAFHSCSGVRGVENWDVSQVTNFEGTFYRGAAASMDLTGWNTKSATTMKTMFKESSFNQDLSGWCVPAVTNHTDTFKDTPMQDDTAKHPVWGTCPRGEDQNP